VPISTIAIDSGFQSLAPFNRAFKRETGLTPTEYRARAMRAAGVAIEPEADGEGPPA
jgi:AraC-like DNA-binding protein